MDMSSHPDPFEKAREEKGFGDVNDQDDPVVMILRHKDVRKCAHNWKTFQSGAVPGRIVVPSEVNIRSTRQIPFEVDPPMHGAYRALVEEWFRRPLLPAYQDKLYEIISDNMTSALSRDSIEVVNDVALPIQSRGLTLLLNIPLAEAETWIDWGTHVFRSEETALDASKAQILYNYIDQQIEIASQHPGEDLYSVLLASEIEGRKLTKEEVKGVMILTFAGGRDTIINAITNTIAYLGAHPGSLKRMRKEPEIISRAVEEFIRYFSPLTHMGRVVTTDTEVCNRKIKSNSRISLCWASANRDGNVFENPNDILLDRKMNPHVGFGFSHHKCLGATHARQLLKVLLSVFCEMVDHIDILSLEENIEHWGSFDRKVGYDQLNVRFNPIK